MCGGSIVSSMHIVTAAHCYYNPRSIYVIAGTLNRNSGGLQNLEVQSFEIHPDYDSNEFDNDVAVITLKLPLTFSTTVQPVS